MDAYDLFKKLSSGNKFNFNRFKNDAERFSVTKKNKVLDKVEIKDEPLTSIQDEKESLKRKRTDDEFDASQTGVVTLLNNIVASKDGSIIKSKKNKKIKTEDKIKKIEQEQVNRFRNIHHISIHGNQVPDPIKSFTQLSEEFNVDKDLVQNIKNAGYNEPTPIQMQAVPIMLQGKQILGCAPTGSGKTAAFLVPIIHHLKGPQKQGFRAIILNPTRELAKQTYRECVKLSEGRDFRIHIISKVNQALSKYGPKSSQKFDILITTPKRLVFLLNQDPPAISLKNVEWLIIDEADKLFEDGTRSFRSQLDEISKACTNPNLRCCMFSATNNHVVVKWCRQNLKDLVTVTIGPRNSAAELVEQELLFVGSEQGKLVAFRNIIQKGLFPPVLVFVQSKERAQELFNELIYDGINVDVIHSDRTSTQRDNVVRCFREGKIWVLVCTELMGRGIDFKGVNLVINYDFPPSAVSYIHRIGRTGRAGHKGKAITFFTQDDTTNLKSIANVLRASGCEVPEYMLAMKKRSKKERRKLEHSAPKRAKISTIIKPRRRNNQKSCTNDKLKERKNESLEKSKENNECENKPGKLDTKDKKNKTKIMKEKTKKTFRIGKKLDNEKSTFSNKNKKKKLLKKKENFES